MFPTARSGPVVHTLQHQQVRYLSKRKIAYPFYPFRKLGKQNPKKHDTNLKYAMRQFLGPKNFKGEYTHNKYFRVPSNHQPNYITPDLEKGQALQDPITGEPEAANPDGSLSTVPPNRAFQSMSIRRRLQPFPENNHCQTNFILSDDLKIQIYDEIQNKGLSTQEVSQKYGIKIPRVEAAVKLVEIEQKWESHNRITPDLRKMSDTLYKMFPVFQPQYQQARENLSEIPIPDKALSSRFLTIAESQPFGPVDASKVLELEPAAETLKKLSTIGQHSAGHKDAKDLKHKKQVIYGELLKGEKSMFKFTHAPVGKVGFRYGSGNRDSKKDRKIGFNELGKMVYI